MPSPIVKSPYLKLDGNLTRGHCFRIHGRREASHETTKVPAFFGLWQPQAMGNDGPRNECFGIVARSSGDVRDEPRKYNIKQEMR